MMENIRDLMRDRYSARVRYDCKRPVTKQQLEQILEAASWAPTAHNMQNVEVVGHGRYVAFQMAEVAIPA
jgi:nitroreductase